jgi:hypothetical protein
MEASLLTASDGQGLLPRGARAGTLSCCGFLGARRVDTPSDPVSSCQDMPPSAIFFTTTRGICSKWVPAFFIPWLFLFMREQYQSADHTGHLFAITPNGR